MIELIITIITLLILVFLAVLILKEHTDKRKNWAMFFSFLYVLISLPIANLLCVFWGLWNFSSTQDTFLKMPLELFFIWVVVWGIIPVMFVRKKFILLTLLFALWIDVLVMPYMAEFQILELSENWIIGELFLLSVVLLPAIIWAKCYYSRIFLIVRASFQVITIGLLFLVDLPLILAFYKVVPDPSFALNPILAQIFFIIIFPALVAVGNLVSIGKGTPFPYDKTQVLVRRGVYAYCRNPMQWSFAFTFVLLAIYHGSFYYLIGSLSAILYTLGVSNPQENTDMENRFGDSWTKYKRTVPTWRFLWKPSQIPVGRIYFNYSCTPCIQVKQWLEKRNLINLSIYDASDFPQKEIKQVTYVDFYGCEHTSIRAIGSALEHANLAWASLGWFMKFPIVSHILQMIINTMGFDTTNSCSVES